MSLFIQLLRTKADPQVFIFVGIFAFVVWIISAYFSRRNKILRALKEKGLKRIRDFSDGDKGKIIGNVIFAGETVNAPLSKRECVYYHVIVEQRVSTGKSHTWRTVVEEEMMGDIVVGDGTGFAIVDANDAMSYLVPDANYSSGVFDDPTPELEDFLSSRKIVSTDFLGFNKTMRYREGVLEKGEMFAVAGVGQWNEAKDHKLNIPSGKVLVVVPAPEEKVLLTDDPEAIQEQEVQ